MNGPNPDTCRRMRRTVSALNVRNRPACHHGAPADDVVRLRLNGSVAWLWIGGEAAPIECRTQPTHEGGWMAPPDPRGLALNVARRLRKRLVIVEE